MAAFLLLCPAPSVFSSLFPSWRGTTAAFLLLCPAPSVFLLSSPPGGASRLLFFSCAPLPRVFLLSSPPGRASWLLFFSCAPLPRVFLLSLPNNQNPVTSLDLISGHTIGLPKGCHRHIIPLSNIPQAVTLTYYINSQ